jgi:hypothetical protein
VAPRDAHAKQAVTSALARMMELDWEHDENTIEAAFRKHAYRVGLRAISFPKTRAQRFETNAQRRVRTRRATTLEYFNSLIFFVIAMQARARSHSIAQVALTLA